METKSLKYISEPVLFFTVTWVEKLNQYFYF